MRTKLNSETLNKLTLKRLSFGLNTVSASHMNMETSHMLFVTPIGQNNTNYCFVKAPFSHTAVSPLCMLECGNS